MNGSKCGGTNVLLLSLRKKEVLTRSGTSVTVEDSMLDEVSRSQDGYHMVPLTRGTGCRQIYRDRKWNGGGRRLGREEGGRVVSVHRVSFWDNTEVPQVDSDGCTTR